jgi:hypothetical protein
VPVAGGVKSAEARKSEYLQLFVLQARREIQAPRVIEARISALASLAISDAG